MRTKIVALLIYFAFLQIVLLSNSCKIFSCLFYTKHVTSVLYVCFYIIIGKPQPMTLDALCKRRFLGSLEMFWVAPALFRAHDPAVGFYQSCSQVLPIIISFRGVCNLSCWWKRFMGYIIFYY